MAEESFSRMNIKELRDELAFRKLKSTGKKRDLVERLKAFCLVEKFKLQDDQDGEVLEGARKDRPKAGGADVSPTPKTPTTPMKRPITSKRVTSFMRRTHDEAASDTETGDSSDGDGARVPRGRNGRVQVEGSGYGNATAANLNRSTCDNAKWCQSKNSSQNQCLCGCDSGKLREVSQSSDMLRSNFAFTFKDIEQSLPRFDGSTNLLVDQWIKEVEYHAGLYEWTAFQTLVFSRKLLTGVALKFITSERGIESWADLKFALRDEFGEELCLAEVHSMISARKMLKTETPYEYFILIKDMARGMVDDLSLIHYVIAGIPDSDKGILYGAESMAEFKKKLRSYEKYKSEGENEKLVCDSTRTTRTDSLAVSPRNFRSAMKEQNTKKFPPGCFNCGDYNHVAAVCTKPKRERGTCFSCGSASHTVIDCPEKKEGGTRAAETRRKEEAPRQERAQQGVHLMDRFVPSFTCKNMLMTFRVSELQMLLGFAGQNTTGRKTELQSRATALVRGKTHIDPLLDSKIRELYRSMQSAGAGVVQGNQMELAPHSSHAGHSMSTQLMPVSRSMGNPLPNFHPLAARTNLYVQNAAGMYPTYPQASKGPPTLPPAGMIQQQQLPLNPDVTLKRIPFYEVEGELLRPSTLIHNPTSREPGTTFHFYLSPTQADAVAFNREISSGKSEYLYQDRPREVQMRFSVCETSCEQEDAFPPGLVAKVNGKACPLPAGPVPINKPATEAKRPPRPVNISALCKLCPSVANTIHLNWTPDYSRGGTYVVGIWVVKRLSAMDLLDKLKAKGPRSAECTAGIIKEKLNEDGDCDIATTSLRVSLICPLGKMKMVTPIRPLTCTHLQCFDATIFLQMNEKKPTWMCPVCNKPALYDNLVIDGYFMDVMSSTDLPPDCHEIQLNKDGSWSSHNPSAKRKATSDMPKANETIQEINDLDSDDSMDTGIGSSDGGPKNEDGVSKPSKVVTVDLTISDSDDDGPAPPPLPAAPAPVKKSLTPAPATTTPDASSNGSSALRSSPSIIMLDSPSPPPREPSPRVQPTAPPMAMPSPSDARSPYLPQQPTPPSSLQVPLTPQPHVVAPPQSILQPQPVLQPHPYHQQVHQSQELQRMQSPYTNYMSFDSHYHPF